MVPPFRLCLSAALVAVALSTPVRASENVVSMSVAVPADYTATSVTTDGATFDGGDMAVLGFSTPTTSYAVGSTADHVFVRRNDPNADQSSVWYATDGGGTNLAGVHSADYGALLLSNNIYSGSDNTFANGSSTDATVGNIERLDFTWTTPLVASDSLAFTVFDRGAVTVHDSFAIAAVIGVDASGNPTAYSSLLKVAAGWGGSINPVGDKKYRLFRYNNGSAITANTANTETGTQGIGGVTFKTSDFGLGNGTLVYGYSLMADDVAATTSAQLLDWKNAAYYPTNTDNATGGGGIDLASVNGIAYTAVPEPHSGIILLLGSLLLGGFGCVAQAGPEVSGKAERGDGKRLTTQE